MRDQHDTSEQLGSDREPHQQRVARSGVCGSALLRRQKKGREHRAQGREAVAAHVSGVVDEKGNGGDVEGRADAGQHSELSREDRGHDSDGSARGQRGQQPVHDLAARTCRRVDQVAEQREEDVVVGRDGLEIDGWQHRTDGERVQQRWGGDEVGEGGGGVVAERAVGADQVDRGRGQAQDDSGNAGPRLRIAGNLTGLGSPGSARLGRPCITERPLPGGARCARSGPPRRAGRPP